MTIKDNDVQEFDLKALLSSSGQYTIPVYQRNFAWGEGEITQLIQDIIDSLKNNDSRHYYLGTLVVYERLENGVSVYETIDGQQRLTTLSILMSVLKNEWKEDLNGTMNWFDSLNLEFKSRKSSSILLTHLFNTGTVEGIDYHKSSNIVAAYNLSKKLLQKILKEENLDIHQFIDYLFFKVKILRVSVPHDTDLNHYFEIMNTRGEQLEKHEIVKAKLLKVFTVLPTPERNEIAHVFNSVWEATSNMERYLQYGFTPTQRSTLFGEKNWGHLNVHNFDELTYAIGLVQEKGKPDITFSIKQILTENIASAADEKVEDRPVRFYSVVNFENFLLHVLRLMKGAIKDIPLDDKRLISVFKEEIEQSPDKVKFVKDFCYNLFKTKYLFDKYIIKREFVGGNDHLSLKRLKRYEGTNVSYVNTFGEDTDESDNNENRKLQMLLSMFHVSTPTMVYKHWLSAALNFPYNNIVEKGNINAPEYIKYLEKIAKSFVFGRHLRNVEPFEYYNVIFNDQAEADLAWDDVDEKKLTFGNVNNNLIFNYIDYLYWKNSDNSDDKITKYEFSYRSSVEHYYPQNPMDGGVKKLTTPEEKKALNCIGNLCLISHSKNSKLSNFSPLQKNEFYSNNIDSIKQYMMMKSGNNWDLQAIEHHDKEVKELLKKELI